MGDPEVARMGTEPRPAEGGERVSRAFPQAQNARECSDFPHPPIFLRKAPTLRPESRTQMPPPVIPLCVLSGEFPPKVGRDALLYRLTYGQQIASPLAGMDADEGGGVLRRVVESGVIGFSPRE